MPVKKCVIFILVFLFFSSLAMSQYKRIFYTGSISGKYQIGFDLNFNKDILQGKYFYYSQSNLLWLDGKINKDGSFTLQESDEQDNKTGSFTGSITKDYSSIEGFWISKDKKKRLPFKLSIDAEYKEMKHDKYSISVEYPVFCINGKNDFKETDLKIYNQSKAYYDSNLNNLEEILKEVTDAKEQEHLSYTSSLNIKYSDKDLKSISVMHYEYSSGAHPNHYYTCHSYYNGNEIFLTNVINTDNASIKSLDKLIISDLEKQEAAWIIDGDKTSYEKELNSNEIPYLFATKGIEFYFSPYIAGPYAQGSFVTPIPYSAVKPLLKPDAPIKYLIK